MTANDKTARVLTTLPNLKQVLFVRYFTAILVDLIVLGLLNEYWDKIELNSFTVALLAAVLLQVLLQVSMRIEHIASGYFKKKPGTSAKVMRWVAAWVILFTSKLIILWAIDVSFGDNFVFHGIYHGVIPFLVLVIAMILAEFLLRWLYHFLGRTETEET